MSIIGFLSDAHGNAHGLRACLHSLERFHVDWLYFLGDAIGYLPGEQEVLQLLRSASVKCQKGNHEAMLLGDLPVPVGQEQLYRLQQVHQRITTDDYALLKTWPEQRVLEIDARRLLLVHGSPVDCLRHYIYSDADFSMFDELDYDAIIMGHTHRPFVVERHGKIIVNVGSCGLPRDQGDLAAFALYDTEVHCCEIYRVQLDITQILAAFAPDQVADEVLRLFGHHSTFPLIGKLID